LLAPPFLTKTPRQAINLASTLYQNESYSAAADLFRDHAVAYQTKKPGVCPLNEAKDNIPMAQINRKLTMLAMQCDEALCMLRAQQKNGCTDEGFPGLVAASVSRNELYRSALHSATEYLKSNETSWDFALPESSAQRNRNRCSRCSTAPSLAVTILSHAITSAWVTMGFKQENVDGRESIERTLSNLLEDLTLAFECCMLYEKNCIRCHPTPPSGPAATTPTPNEMSLSIRSWFTSFAGSPAVPRAIKMLDNFIAAQNTACSLLKIPGPGTGTTATREAVENPSFSATSTNASLMKSDDSCESASLNSKVLSDFIDKSPPDPSIAQLTTTDPENRDSNNTFSTLKSYALSSVPSPQSCAQNNFLGTITTQPQESLAHFRRAIDDDDNVRDEVVYNVSRCLGQCDSADMAQTAIELLLSLVAKIDNPPPVKPKQESSHQNTVSILPRGSNRFDVSLNCAPAKHISRNHLLYLLSTARPSLSEKSGDFPVAVDACNELLENNGKDSDGNEDGDSDDKIRHTLIYSLLQMNRATLALQKVQVLLSEGSFAASLYAADAILCAEIQLQNPHEIDEGVAHLKGLIFKAAEHSPDNLVAKNNCAIAYLMEGDVNSAIKLLSSTKSPKKVVKFNLTFAHLIAYHAASKQPKSLKSSDERYQHLKRAIQIWMEVRGWENFETGNVRRLLNERTDLVVTNSASVPPLDGGLASIYVKSKDNGSITAAFDDDDDDDDDDDGNFDIDPKQSSLMDVIILSVAVQKLQAEDRANRKRKREAVSSVVGVSGSRMGGVFGDASLLEVGGINVPKLGGF